MPTGGGFPPERHLGRDLGISYRLPGPGRILLSAPCNEHVLRADGAVSSEVLCAVVDEAVGFMAVLAVLPDWGSTAALSFGFTGAEVEPGGELTVEGRVLKAGRRLVFVECTVVHDDVLVAHAEGQFARVGRAGSNVGMEVPSPDPEEEWHMGGEDDGLAGPLADALGFRREGRDSVSMAFHEYASNSAGILHGGAASALVVAAAEHAAEAPALHAGIQFLAAGRKGPFVATASPLEGQIEGVWRSTTRDTADDTVMNRAVVRTR